MSETFTFLVDISRTEWTSLTVSVTADDEDQAREAADQHFRDAVWDLSECDWISEGCDSL